MSHEPLDLIVILNYFIKQRTSSDINNYQLSAKFSVYKCITDSKMRDDDLPYNLSVTNLSHIIKLSKFTTSNIVLTTVSVE